MTIWIYPDIPEDSFPFEIPGLLVRTGSTEGRAIVRLWEATACPFCQGSLIPIAKEHKKSDVIFNLEKSEYPKEVDFKTSVNVCENCGWWNAQRIESWATPAGYGQRIFQGGASLKELDLKGIKTPLNEVRSFLLSKYESRYEINPRLFEETVASVFESFGYQTWITAYSGDGGIDIILNDGNSTVGVQVKRYKRAIAVEQIRSLAGALLLRGITNGIFVTTSSFQSGALSTAEGYQEKGYKIELLDANRFYDALKLTKGSFFSSIDEFESVVSLAKLPEIFASIENY